MAQGDAWEMVVSEVHQSLVGTSYHWKMGEGIAGSFTKWCQQKNQESSYPESLNQLGFLA